MVRFGSADSIYIDGHRRVSLRKCLSFSVIVSGVRTVNRSPSKRAGAVYAGDFLENVSLDRRRDNPLTSRDMKYAAYACRDRHRQRSENNHAGHGHGQRCASRFRSSST